MEPLARLPVFLALDGKRVVVAGGSAAAAWKAELLSAAGAAVDVLRRATVRRAAARSRPIRRAAPSRCTIAPGSRSDLAGAAIAVGGFDDDEEAARFAAAARAAGVPVNVIDKPAFCDFSFGAIVNRSPLVIGISTDGAAPVFGQAIRAKLEALIPRGFARWADAAARAGARRCSHRASPFAARRRFWQLFTALAVHAPGPRAERRPISIALLPRCESESATPRSRLASRWSAPAPAIRSC